MQRCAVWTTFTHSLDGPIQAQSRRFRGHICRAGRLDYRQGITLVGGYFDWQNPESSATVLATAKRKRRLAILDLSSTRPAGAALNPCRCVDQTARPQASGTSNLRAHITSLDCGGLQCIICAGDGNGDNTASDSPRGAGALYTRASLLPEDRKPTPSYRPTQTRYSLPPNGSEPEFYIWTSPRELVYRECH